MLLKQTLLATAIVLAPVAAFAGGSIDAFYTDNDLNIQGIPDAGGSGYGFRGQADLGKGFSIIGLRQSSRIKPLVLAASSSAMNETRLGLSYKHQLNKQTSLTGSFETVQFGTEIGAKNSGFGATLNGYAANVGVNVAVIKKVNAYASVGYVNLGKLNNQSVNGYEYTGGLSYDLCDHWAGFAEYRAVRVSTDALGSNRDIDNNTLRVGGRYTF